MVKPSSLASDSDAMVLPKTQGRSPRSLPVTATPARRRLPLAHDTRPIDAAWRPVYAVWEITLRCDLACHHCGSRAGRPREGELTTAEALDVVRQMAALGVKEVTLIGGEAYLRQDWTEIARAVREHGMLCSMTTGGRGLTQARARAAQDAGIQAVSVSIDGLRDTHDAMRGLRGSFDSAPSAMRHLHEAGVRVLSNTHINRTNLGELEAIFELLAAERVAMWMFQITVAMGRAADRPGILLEPHQVLDLMPRLARLKPRADAANLRMIPGSDIGYFGPYEALLRPHMPDRHCGSCGAGRLTLGLEANGDVKGVSVASLERLRRRQPARALAEGNLGAGVRPALHARSDGRRPARVRPQLLLRRGVPGRLHLDDSHALRQARRRSVLPPPRARAAAPGQARDTASRARRTGARA